MKSKGIEWNKKPLGLISDQKLAQILGVNRSTVSKARRRRGIPKYADSRLLKPKQGFFDVATLKPSKCSEPKTRPLLHEGNFLSEYHSMRNEVDETLGSALLYGIYSDNEFDRSYLDRVESYRHKYSSKCTCDDCLDFRYNVLQKKKHRKSTLKNWGLY